VAGVIIIADSAIVIDVTVSTVTDQLYEIDMRGIRFPYIFLLQRILTLLYKHKSCLECQTPAALPVSATFKLPDPEDIVGSQHKDCFSGSAEVAILTFEKPSGDLAPDFRTYHQAHEREKALREVPMKSRFLAKKLSPVIMSPMLQPPLHTDGLAGVSEVLENPDEAAASCIHVMCDFDHGPAQVRVTLYPSSNKYKFS
jgi:hypothetical protein